MPGVRLNLKPGIRPTDFLIQDVDGLVVLAPTSQTSSHLDLNFLFDVIFEVVEVIIASQDGETISVHHQLQVPGLVREAAWRSPALDESHPSQGSAVGLLPKGCCLPGAVHAPLEPAAVAGHPDFLGELDIRGSVDVGIEISLTRVDEQELLLSGSGPSINRRFTEH